MDRTRLVSEMIGLIRDALQSWPRTLRLVVLVLTAAAAIVLLRTAR